MRVRFLHDGDGLLPEKANGRRSAPRPLGAADRQRIGDWLNRYAAILEDGAAKDSGESALLALGREIADWLDGPERWLSSLLRPGAARPLEIEFVAEDPEQEGASDFLALPWEILATAKGFLAADATLGFCPIRRVGVAAAPRPPADDHALTILFLSATPQGESELWVEQEEVAILKSAGRLPLDLVVEDGGTLDDLRERLSLEWPVEVLHLSCHGLAGRDGDPPMLALEDELGVCAPIDPAAFLDALGPDHRLRLLFLSACETAADAAGVDPFILPMMAAGQPAAIGWAGSVYDSNASAFAAALYQRIAGGDRLEAAVASARRALLAPPNGQDRLPHWHLARLFLSGDGGGALCRPRARRRQRPFDHAESRFFGNNRRVPAVGRTGFVGRRREVQRALRVLRDRRRGCAGLLLHGAGHLGKSSLAARIADRMTGHEPAVVYGACDIDSVWKALAVARPGFDDRLGLDPAALRERPEAIHAAMRRVLDGPLRDEPVLLVLDDFEQCLDLSATGRPTVKVAALPVLEALLRAFVESSGDSALLITCRFRFALAERLKGTLEEIPLHPFDAGTRLKQAASRLRDRKAGDVADDLLDRCLEAARGNPGLQDLLIALALSAPEKAERAVAALDGWLAGTERPDDAQCAERLDHLMLDTLWECVDADGRQLLRAVAGIELPLPLPALSVLARHVGMADAAFDRLLSLSVFDLFRDVVEPDRPAAAPCHLLAPRIAALEPLTEAESADFARALLPALFAEWEDDGTRPYEADVVLAGLAVRAGDAGVLRVVAAKAIYCLIEMNQFRRAAQLGKRAILLINGSGLLPPLQLLRYAANVSGLTGNIEFARQCLSQAMGRLNKDAAPNDVSTIRTEYARLLVKIGELDQAMEIFTANLELHHKLDDVRERAITLGDIARLKASRGSVEEALTLHEERLVIYKKIGEVQERAITLGDIAHLKASQGSVEEALALHEEELAIYVEIGKRRLQAITLGDIARLKASSGFVDEALALHEERLAILLEIGDLDEQANCRWSRAILRLSKTDIGVEQVKPVVEDLTFAYQTLTNLGRVDGIAVVGFDLARLMAKVGLYREAREIAERSLEIFNKLRWAKEVDMVQKFLISLSKN
jgi:tetratricopeptide (TPR) repeat protein